MVPGPFTADLAACLADLPRSETAAALANLVHRSMLTALGARRPGAPSRFSQLATIRAHGLGLPGSDRRRNAEERRDRWVGDLIADIPYVGHVSEHAWHARIDDDLAAVRATLQHGLIDQPGPVGTAVAARLGLYWFYRGMVVEWERWTGIAAASPAADPFDRLLAGCSYAGVAGLTGRGELHRSWMDELDAYPVPLSHDQKVWLGQFLLTVGLTTWITGDLVASQRAADRMRTLAAETGAPILDLLGEVCRLLVASQVGDPDVVLPELNACYQTDEQRRTSTPAGSPQRPASWPVSSAPDPPRACTGQTSCSSSSRTSDSKSTWQDWSFAGSCWRWTDNPTKRSARWPGRRPWPDGPACDGRSSPPPTRS